jgi:hypothetical protein
MQWNPQGYTMVIGGSVLGFGSECAALSGPTLLSPSNHSSFAGRFKKQHPSLIIHPGFMLNHRTLPSLPSHCATIRLKLPGFGFRQTPTARAESKTERLNFQDSLLTASNCIFIDSLHNLALCHVTLSHWQR